MPTVLLHNGCLLLTDADKRYLLSAEDVYSVIFEDTRVLRQVAVTPEDFAATGLDFHRHTADATIVIEPDPAALLPSVRCRLVAKALDFETDVPSHAGLFMDYATDGTTWFPLPTDTPQVSQSFLKRFGLTSFGPMSLGQYVSIMGDTDSTLPIDDRTNDALSATHIASTLRGDLPEQFVGKLYHYQEAGYNWLAYMRRNGIGCIIADEMGLGKTVQVICLLLDAKSENAAPSLVLAPATLLENWRREIHRFAPDLSILVHAGPQRAGLSDTLLQQHVTLCSYETAVADISLLNNVEWNVLVVDEAQAIKNPSAKRTLRIKSIRCLTAIAMTGTPLQNRLTDLWSITDFVMPSLLGTQSEFERRHPNTVSAAADLEPGLTPLILRRRVSEVAPDLPQRIDIPQPLELDAHSAQVYELLRQAILGEGSTNLSALTRLRMFCTHPWLTDQFTHVPSAPDCSVKLQRLLEIVEEIAQVGQKALVFTSYQKSVDLIAKELADRFGIPAVPIDGRTPLADRQAIIDRFSAITEPSVLVLNPRAAGTGLNIAAANHVIHFNLEWNPAVEDQATARAYRRGQTRTVTVHRLYYINTVEEVINDRMDQKRALAETAVVGTDGVRTDLHDVLRALHVSPLQKNTGGIP